MILPENADSLSDAALKRWLIMEGGYDSDAADYVVDVVRGRENAEELD